MSSFDHPQLLVIFLYETQKEILGRIAKILPCKESEWSRKVNGKEIAQGYC